LSLILYLYYYSADLEIVGEKERDHFIAGYIDDTMLAVESGSVEENIRKYNEVMPRAFHWSPDLADGLAKMACPA
jgi:hypothetical protein